MKLWGGRFSSGQDEIMRRFNDSLYFDRRLYAADIQGSEAYAGALHRAAIIDDDEHAAILKGLAAIRKEFEEGTFAEKIGDEDIHTAVERRLSELIGAPAGKLHTGRSRNDQVALDLRIYLLGVIDDVTSALAALQNAIIRKSEENLRTIMPGYTHLQPAQPVLFSHWLMSFFWMFDRDKDRLADGRKRTGVSPLGSGALAGNPFRIDRRELASALNMTGVTWNSMDAVSDRDFVADFQFAAAMISLHISRLAEDLILFSNPGFGFVTVAEAYSTGSSLMPQKRNPDSLELARGKAGRVVSGLLNLMVVLKGLPSTYNKDLQEDKEALFDTVDTLELVLPVIKGVIETLAVHPERMAAALDEVMLATDMADYLVEKGLPFREAHQLTGQAVRLAESRQVPISQIPLEDLGKISALFEADVFKYLDFKRAIEKRAGIGGTSESAVRQQIHEARKRLRE